MRIVEQTSDDVTILTIDGRVTRDDGYGALKACITDLVATGQRHVLLNLSDVPYLDSSGVGELVSVFITVRNHGGILKLTGASGRVAELLAVAKLDTVFEMFDSESTALASFTRG